MSLAEKLIGGSLVLIGIFLVVTNPTGSSAATNSISSGGVSFIKALQGR